MKFFLKRLNNKKGFTLIELIVVIAILAILALIAIPRFAGFTDKAKIQTDEQYAALVGNAIMTLAAAGDIELDVSGDDPTVTIDGADGVIEGHTDILDGNEDIDDGSTKALSDKLNDLVEVLVAAKPAQYYEDNMVITLNLDGVQSITGTK